MCLVFGVLELRTRDFGHSLHSCPKSLVRSYRRMGVVVEIKGWGKWGLEWEGDTGRDGTIVRADEIFSELKFELTLLAR